MGDNNIPLWTNSLQRCGEYYKGIVENAAPILEMHKQDTVTTFGIRRTEKPTSTPKSRSNKENENASNTPKVMANYDQKGWGRIVIMMHFSYYTIIFAKEGGPIMMNSSLNALFPVLAILTMTLFCRCNTLQDISS